MNDFYDGELLNFYLHLHFYLLLEKVVLKAILNVVLKAILNVVLKAILNVVLKAILNVVLEKVTLNVV
jgi:hypothetical protein